MDPNLSIGLPPRKRIPLRAPEAIPAKIADGIESTKAHGEATTSKVMVL